jgi:hypothetical protein
MNSSIILSKNFTAPLRLTDLNSSHPTLKIFTQKMATAVFAETFDNFQNLALLIPKAKVGKIHLQAQKAKDKDYSSNIR